MNPDPTPNSTTTNQRLPRAPSRAAAEVGRVVPRKWESVEAVLGEACKCSEQEQIELNCARTLPRAMIDAGWVVGLVAGSKASHRRFFAFIDASPASHSRQAPYFWSAEEVSLACRTRS